MPDVKPPCSESSSTTAKPLRYSVRWLLGLITIVAMIATVFHWIPFAWWYVVGASVWLLAELASMAYDSYRGIARALGTEDLDE
ncbi:hypothetical protein NG895_08565 [Aeoliella sp. ICT_H6.2]|uniref:2TM domain-containing protein n=1 Tax=Aeoliella straminimaris TaxID=2954799 RepID=A0A9X2F963_9BACT|nr:hypothetical protein [Aeoliella straminimaris]MCO6043958.1 hypothetical protein [Aeoliella straminimaris]